jgi:hypothetical protein
MEENKKMKTWKLVSILAILALVSMSATAAATFALGGWGIQATVLNQQAVTTNQQVSLPQQALAPVTQTNTQTPTLYTPTFTNRHQYGGWGGCWGHWANGIIGTPTTTTTTPLTISQAVDIAKTYVTSLNNPVLTVKQVEEYTNNFYVIVADKNTGNGAFELLINKVTGIVAPEPGPNMMWNTQYSFGAGWCNWARGPITATPTVTVEQAKTYAQQYLNSYLAGTTVGDVTTFSGHYTIEVLNNATPYGMLSVNSFTGQVWYHNWHGAFIAEQTVS